MNRKIKTEDKKQDNQNEEKSKTKKVVSTFIVLDILLVIIVILLLCLKSCKPTNEESSSEADIDMMRVNKITDVFRGIVKKNIEFNSYDNDQLDKVMAITYEDNYPNNFSLNISVTSENKVYYCVVTDYPYDGNKEEYNDFLSYLLLDTAEYRPTNSYCELHPYSKTDTKVNNSKPVNRYVIGETSSEPKDYYLYGFYKENDEFCVYQNALIVDSVDPFSNPSDQIIKSDSPLYGYYKGLLIAQ